METDFRSVLTGDATIAGLVGTRIRWNRLEQDETFPAIALFLIDSAPGYHLQGSDHLHTSRVQVDIYAATHQAALAIRNAVDARLSAFAGTQGGTRFHGVFKAQERQTFERPDNLPGLHRISIDFDVRHSATS